MGDELDPTELCQEAGVPSDGEVTKFVMEDVAGALISCDWEREKIIRALKAVNLFALGDSLCEASGWVDIFEAACESALGEE